MRLLAIDPGIHTGCAIFVDGVLVHTFLGEPSATWKKPDRCIIELPQVYRKDKANPNDLITLAVRVGRYVERVGCPVDLIAPATWKGQLSKEVTKRRLQAALSPGELLNIPHASRHDVWDAVGLGRWYVKGQGRPGVF